MAQHRRVTSTSTSSNQTGFRSRRGSLSSINSLNQVDKEALSHALDEIHTTASKTDTLTSFSDFDSKGSGGRGSGTKEFVSGGISGLYSRLRQSVGAASSPAWNTDASARPGSRASFGYGDTSSGKTLPTAAIKSSFDDKTKPASPSRMSPARPSKVPVPVPAPASSSTPAPTHISNHVSRSSVNLPSNDVSSIASRSPAASTAFDYQLDEEMFISKLAPPLQRPPPKPASRPGSRDLSNLPMTKMQTTPGAAFAHNDRPDASNRSSFHGPFRDDSAVLPDDFLPALTSPMPGSEAMQPPLDRAASGLVSISEKSSRGRSQTLPPSEIPYIITKSAISSPSLQPSLAINNDEPKERPTLRVSPSHLPNLHISQPSSNDGANSAINSRMATPLGTPLLETPQNFNAGFQTRRPLPKQAQPANAKSAVVPAHLKRRVLSKEFWMKDENAKECFHCGNAFSTFRRKHHCRTCGQIFCSQCTDLLPGKDFGQPGRLRLCRPCEAMIYGSDDDSTVFTDDDQIGSPHPHEDNVRFETEQTNIATPSIGIPVSKRNRDMKRRSAVIEFDQPLLARPSSSRSLKSMTGRPKSANHRRRQSRQQPVRTLKHTPEERGPFYQDAHDSNTTPLAALNNDAFIDPDLADYMSDEYSDDDGPSIFATLNGELPTSSPNEGADRAGLSGLSTSAFKKGRSRRGDRSIAGQSVGRESEGAYLASRYGGKLSRKRNASVSSFVHGRPSPRRSRSTNLLKSIEYGGFDAGTTSPLAFEAIPSLRGPESEIRCSSNMHGSNAPAIELNSASLQHVRRLLAQLLKDMNITHRKRWEKALLPILLQCTDDVDPDVQNGDDMDIRNYIKLKKIPGGKPGDTAYVSGVVFSKNVALKDMKRKWIKPRIVIITFPIEYTRHHSSFFTLENLIAQEKEYVCMLVGRIIALKPQILLVERNVCGLALRMLQEAGVTVVFNIKESVLAAVARVTQTVLIKSQDKLSIDPDHLGQCGVFEVKTYLHGGMKKSYVWMSGCQPDLGCTIVLRGADMETLRLIKRIAEFMSYVVYNLKLETCLMRDEFVLIPPVPSTPSASQPKLEPMFELSTADSEPVTPTPRAERQNPMEVSILESHSQTVLADYAAAQNNILSHLVDATEHESEKPVISEPEPERVQEQKQEQEQQTEDEAMPSEYRELIETARSRLISSSPFVQFTEPYLLVKAQEQERKVEQSKRLRDRYDAFNEAKEKKQQDNNGEFNGKTKPKTVHEFQLVIPDMLQQASPEEQPETVRTFIRDMHDAQYEMALREYEIGKRQWESFFSSSGNDPFNPFNHQNIWVLHSIVSSVTSVPCAGPEVFGLGFYAGFGHPDEKLEEDCTLGQFVEDMCAASSTTCKVCSRKMLEHHRQYVHGPGQLSVSVKRQPSKYPGLRSTIFMWSTCKICKQETTWMPMSDSSWKYSFGKYLELSFWSTPLKPRAGVCPHDIHKDFIRCFAFQGLVVRVQYDPVALYDVIVPRTIIAWDVNEGLVMKNQLFTQFEIKLEAFMTSVKNRLASINLSTVAPEKSTDATAMVEKLMHRAENDHAALLRKLQDKYMCSQFYEIVPMNRALRMMDEKAIAWDDAFAEFERNYFPSENDIRRLATLQLKKLFLDRGEVVDKHLEDASDTDDGMEMQDRTPSSSMKLTDEELQSEKAQNMLSSVVEEHGHSGAVDEPNAAVTDSLSEEENKMDIPDTSVLSKQLSPIEIEQAVERDDVKHLDLAVPAILSPDTAVDMTLPLVNDESKSSLDSNTNRMSESFAVEPKPLNSAILERIEQMRSAASNSASPLTEPFSESKIPRLAGLRNRVGGAAPGLARAQSQPNHVPRRSIDLSADLPMLEPVGSNEQSGSATPTQQSNVPSRDLAKSIEQRLSDRLGTGRKAQASLIPRSVPNKADNITRVSALAKHFEQLSREFERERLRERKQRAARSRQVRANPLASSRPVVEVYTDPRLAVGEEKVDTDYDRIPLSGPDQYHEQSRQSPENIDHLSQKHQRDEGDSADQYATDTDTAESIAEGQTDTETEEETTDAESTVPSPGRPRDRSDPLSSMSSSSVLTPASPGEIDSHLDLSIPKHEKNSLMKMLTSFWSERSASGWLPLEYPFLPTEHVFDDSDIVVREDEPASVIALALSCADYVTKVDAFRLNPSGPKTSSHSHSASQGSFSFAAQFSSTGESAQAAIEASLISPTGTHMKYSFAHGPVKTTCKIFYAESFDALRRKCGVADRFVESLSRCAKWDSKGGKTKSLFLKTLDDRFVIKSLQEVELKAFTKFAPDYFSFMSHTLFHGVPSVIAKMFGLFQVIIKNPATGTEFSSYLLVMENLFYSRNPTRRFDLKGSMRNRKIESTGQPDEVLLDENLVETIFETPLFVREHARKLLRAGVWNDTMWLCKQNVMDYSLMAGFDDEKKELVVGIIDCIRTYTWDKKLESWIKDRGKNKPTITSPKDYRNRFRVSMMQYVLQAPNVWHGFLNQSVSPSGMQGTIAVNNTVGSTAVTSTRRKISSSQGPVAGSLPGTIRRGELGTVEGAMGRGFEGAEPGVIVGGSGGGGGGAAAGAPMVVMGKKEREKEMERVAAGEGALMDEATIREMSTMTFA